MATNPYINKVIFGQNTLIDISDSNVVESDVAAGKKFYKADGSPAIGTSSGGAGSAIIVDTLDEGGGTIRTITTTDEYHVQASKTVTPTDQVQVITPDTGYDALASVTVNAGGSTGPEDAYKVVIHQNQQGLWVPSETYAELAEIRYWTPVVFVADEEYVQVSYDGFSNSAFNYSVVRWDTDDTSYWLDASSYAYGSNGVTQTYTYRYYDSGDGDAIVANVLSGKIFYNSSGRQVGSATARTSSDLTASGATVTVPAGIYSSQATKSVASGTEGTPTATKGTVSNHAISVTPSVTNTAGYIAGSTKTGTAVTVTASELASGNKEINANGTNIDVVGYSTVTVNVPTPTPTLITKSITANGTYNASSDSADGYSSVTVNVSGGGEPEDEYAVQFIDYDGTVLYHYTPTQFAALSAMPANPTHTGLTAQGWNWTLSDAKAQVTAIGKCIVGQMYTTTDGKTRIYLHFADDKRLNPYLALAPNGTITVDWGDNSQTDTLTGTALTTLQYVQHTYPDKGDYVMTLTATSGAFAFLGTSSVGGPLRKDTGTNSIAGTQSRSFLNAIQKVEIGTGATISSYAFADCYSLESITIPNTVTRIGSYAFKNCYSLVSVNIPSGVTGISSGIAYYCQSLKSISIPNSVTGIEINAFYYCYRLTSVSLPNTITSIEGNTFYSCSSLTSVNIPNTITAIDNSTFYGCCSLTSINIPNTVTSIGNNVFTGCYSLTSINIPNTVTSIGNSAFADCRSLTSINIPNTVTSIGQYVFQNCYSLISVNIPSGITTIDSGMFNSCYSLASISIPSGVTTIKNSAFYNCFSLTSITIPNAVTSIGASAFCGCYSLASITIPNAVTRIDQSAFYGCYSLASFDFPSSYTGTALNQEFRNCYSLTALTIPSTITSIAANTFNGCGCMAEYHFLPTTPPTLASTSAFTSMPADCKIYVPYSADHSILEAYQTATNWSTLSQYIVEEPQS